MKSLIFAFEAVSPIIITVVIGFLLKKIGLISVDLSKKLNKLVFRVFLPVLLFKNIYSIESIAMLDFGYVIYSVVAVGVLFGLGIPLVIFLTDKKKCRGALLQSIFRSNYALIGIPLATELFGAEGAAVATLLSAFVVPTFNILAVIGLSLFNNSGEKIKLKKVLMGILKNPLIIGIVIGLATLGVRALLKTADIGFRLDSVSVIWKPLNNLSVIATPLALLALGAQFEFSAIPTLKREILSGILLRCLAVPVLGIGIAYLIFRETFGGAQFAALVAVFCTPVAVSSVPMAQEMGADTELAGQLVVFTTMISGFTVFIASFLLKAAGIF